MITVIDYGLGNLASVATTLEKLRIPYQVSDDIAVIKNAQGLILPGVGAAGQGMSNLKKRGLDTVLQKQSEVGAPILGICLGMQLLLSSSEEGCVPCLNLIKGKVKKFERGLRVPQIGWNQVEKNANSLLLKDIKNKSDFYFVNSYHCNPDDKTVIKGLTNYGVTFCSVLEKNNLYGVQFHPEKSGIVGFELLKNFIRIVKERKNL